MKKNLTEDETIMRDYDVEFYMKRGLTNLIKYERLNELYESFKVKCKTLLL